MLSELNNPMVLGAVIIGTALLPMLFLGVTSYLKLNVVFSILRNAIGAQQLPSSAITSLLALALSLHIMAPVGREMAERFTAGLTLSSAPKKAEFSQLMQYWEALSYSVEPLENFLRQHSKNSERRFFLHSWQGMNNLGAENKFHEDENTLKQEENIFTLLPSFMVTELGRAFSLGILIFLPFLVVDLVVVNVLLALGMTMVNPVNISIPLKLLLFVLTDGWFLLSRALVLSYS